MPFASALATDESTPIRVACMRVSAPPGAWNYRYPPRSARRRTDVDTPAAREARASHLEPAAVPRGVLLGRSTPRGSHGRTRPGHGQVLFATRGVPVSLLVALIGFSELHQLPPSSLSVVSTSARCRFIAAPGVSGQNTPSS